MPKMTKPARKLDKSTIWLSYFLDSSNKATFLQRKSSALAAGYKDGGSASVMGERNYIKFAKEINTWLDEVGLSENALKNKMLELMGATQTQFFASNGIVTDQREVPAIETQRKTLDMALKVKGLYAPEKIEHVGLTVQVVRFCDTDQGNSAKIAENIKIGNEN